MCTPRAPPQYQHRNLAQPRQVRSRDAIMRHAARDTEKRQAPSIVSMNKKLDLQSVAGTLQRMKMKEINLRK
jgi:hypothetical protein